jgi:SDR family mycofactocin-dependent oxidoreductase
VTARALDGQVVLITGGARGQGRTHAVGAARLGAAVVLADVPEPVATAGYGLATKEDLDETKALVEAEGGECLALVVDVRDAEQVQGAVDETLARFGRLDGLVANAGIAGQAKVWEVTDQQWRDMVEVNLSGVFHSLRAAVPPMLERGYGRVVVTASMGGRMGIPNIGHYNATKWGVIGLAKSLALEVCDRGITVNVVCPCTVATPMVTNAAMFQLFSPDSDDHEAILEKFRRVNPIPKPWLEPEDVTREVLHLLTDPGNITGAVIEIGLGSSARLH